MIDPSSVQYLVINSPDYLGRQFAIVSSERVDTGDGVLKGPILPLPTLLMNLFGTTATFYLNGVSAYNPTSGVVTSSTPSPVTAKVYPESYSLADRSAAPEILDGDIKVYVPGQAFGYKTTALLILQVRESGGVTARVG
jgi:hypothetical protein